MLQPEVLAVVGFAGLFPEATDTEAFWSNILAHRRAPALPVTSLWVRGAGGDASGREQLEGFRACTLPTQLFESLPKEDRSVVAGRLVTEQALGGVEGEALRPEEVALVCGTSLTAESYFVRDARRVRGLQSERPGTTVAQQLAGLADSALVAGPRLAVDTACASSLYAIDLARGLIETNQARRVVVLGLNVGLAHFYCTGFSQLKVMSPKAETHPFSRHASGFVLGESAAAIVVEPLSLTRRGDKVHGLIRAIGTSADGADRSVFAPSSRGQLLAYQRAYEELPDREVDYIEAHGTATATGDETEIVTLQRFFGEAVRSPASLPLGSVKALVGHTLAAAGMVSVIKGLLMLRHRIVPPHPVDQPHPRLQGTALELPQQQRPLLSPAHRPVRVGISSFGFGGANAHLVLEAHEPEREWTSRAPRARLGAPLAILDLELAVAGTTDSESAARALACPASAHHRLPSEDRWLWATESDRAALGPGAFFPEAFSADASGLRMGPRLLQRLDPLQLLLTELARRVVSRNDCLKQNPDVSVVVTANLGGQGALSLSREHSSGTHQEGEEKKTVSTERLASSLPGMCSGYQAYHFDFQGAHLTLAGPPGVFWTSFFLAPYWLAREGSALLLSGARQIKGPVDVEEAVQTRRERSSGEGEGAGLFLLTTEADAQKQRQDALCVVRAVISGADASSWTDACHQAQIDPRDVDLHEVCQLDPGHPPSTGSAQEATGFLAEATGIESLGRVVLHGQRLAALELRQGERLRATIFFERRSPSRASREAPRLPLTVSFDERRTDLGGPVREAAPKTREDESAAAIEVWLNATAQGLRAYFDCQRTLLRLLPPQRDPVAARDCHRPRVSVQRWDPRQTVLLDVRRRANGAVASLKVDESDSYFFDHPLDHVPAILLIEAVYQLAEIISGEKLRFISSFDARFVRFCDKDQVTTVGLEAEGSDDWYGFRILQANKLCAQGRLQQRCLPSGVRHTPKDAGAGQGTLVTPDSSLVHKRHQKMY